VKSVNSGIFYLKIINFNPQTKIIRLGKRKYIRANWWYGACHTLYDSLYFTTHSEDLFLKEQQVYLSVLVNPSGPWRNSANLTVGQFSKFSTILLPSPVLAVKTEKSGSSLRWGAFSGYLTSGTRDNRNEQYANEWYEYKCVEFHFPDYRINYGGYSTHIDDLTRSLYPIYQTTQKFEHLGYRVGNKVADGNVVEVECAGREH
jgi:hypothetical protein